MSRTKSTRRRAAHQPRPLRHIPPQSDAYLGRLNVYTCEAGHEVVTIDRDPGVTPSGMLCRHTETRGFPAVEVQCELRARSAFYRVPDGLVAAFEWYRPDDEERRRLNPYQAEHVDRGGLLLRPITAATAQVDTDQTARSDGGGD